MITKTGSPHIFISCGERSGDEHAANVVKQLKELIPDARFSAIGGSALATAGVQIIRDINKSSGIMGFTAVIKKLPSIWRELREARAYVAREKPDLCLFIDYPDFNLRLARVAKMSGCKTLYFIPPKLWAWRKGRIESFKRYVDRAAVFFPFEANFFHEHGYKAATFVGHPFTRSLDNFWSQEKKHAARLELCEKLQIAADGQIVAIFPGSRRSEVRAHAALVSELTQKLLKFDPSRTVVIAATQAVDDETTDIFIRAGAIVSKDLASVTILQASDCAVLKSGTSNLQAAYTDTPACMFFVTSELNYIIVKLLVSLRFYSPLNIILPATINEFVQRDATAVRLAEETERLLSDTGANRKQSDDYGRIRKILAPVSSEESGVTNPAGLVAAMAKQLLGQS